MTFLQEENYVQLHRRFNNLFSQRGAFLTILRVYSNSHVACCLLNLITSTLNIINRR